MSNATLERSLPTLWELEIKKGNKDISCSKTKKFGNTVAQLSLRTQGLTDSLKIVSFPPGLINTMDPHNSLNTHEVDYGMFKVLELTFSETLRSFYCSYLCICYC